MDDLRGSLSKLKKDFKHRFRKADKTRVSGRGEEVDSSSSLQRPESRVAASSGHEQGNESNAGDENRPGWKSNASASAKSLLRGVRDSADAFGPLKSVAGGLCFILENCEVRPPLHHTPSITLTGS